MRLRALKQPGWMRWFGKKEDPEMTWYDGKIMCEADFAARPEPSKTRFQFGDHVWVQFIDQERSELKYVEIPGRIAGIHIRQGNQVLYDVAVPIAGTLYYAVMENLQGQIIIRTRSEATASSPGKLELVK
jgi:hypothetical protein